MKKGFTLIEVMVTIGILTIITTSILINHTKFNSNLALKMAVQEIAHNVYQAQVYGFSSKSYYYGSEWQFPSYGIHFDKNTPASYILFVDLNKSQEYEAGETIKTFQIQNGNKIDDLCRNEKSPPYTCGLNKIDVIYKRSDFVASLKSGGNTPISDAEIKIKSPKGQSKIIVIWISGQIAVE